MKQRATLKYRIPQHNHLLVYRITPPFNIIPTETSENALQLSFAPTSCDLPGEWRIIEG